MEQVGRSSDPGEEMELTRLMVKVIRVPAGLTVALGIHPGAFLLFGILSPFSIQSLTGRRGLLRRKLPSSTQTFLCLASYFVFVFEIKDFSLRP